MELPFTILGWFHVILIAIPILLFAFIFVWYHISNIIKNFKELFK
ncbi:hypothetical protein [Staphylococcus phage PT1-9]